MVWQDILEIFLSELSLRQKYHYFYDALHRVCIEKTRDLPSDYNDFFSRLQAVCRLTSYPLYRVDTFRWRARRVECQDLMPDERTFLVDVRAFADAMAHFTGEPIPRQLKGLLPDGELLPVSVEQIRQVVRKKRQRFVVQSIEAPYIEAISHEIPSETPFRIDASANQHTLQAVLLLKPDMQFNALSFTIDTEGIYHPQYIIVEPDFLLDTTTVTGCVKAWGESAFNHLLAKFKPSESTVYTLLGDFSNQFLDDALNLPAPDYRASMQKVFSERVLDISACAEIDKGFFEETQKQFHHILQVVRELNLQPFMREGRAEVHIEPSFFCEALGLQGRMDCLITNDVDERKFLIELKSGKWDEFRNRAKDEHLMQMLLYKEILYYNTGVRQADVIGNLLYSKYPKLQEQRSFQEMVQRAMNIRNNIVALELGLLHGEARKWIPKLTPQALRRNLECNDKFWQTWCLPEISSVIGVLQNMDSLTSEYFYTFLQFIEREQFESKVCNARPDSTRALSSLWNADANIKKENGDIIVDLQIADLRVSDGVDAVCLCMLDRESLPNFRIGDSVIFYQRQTDADSAVTKQVLRCSVESCEDGCIWLKLRNKQRNERVFDKDAKYAIEHDHVDANFRSLYNGLFSLLTCSKHRRELLLCQREPAAEDIFLLAGPPGTGKTSVALKRMVEEHLHAEQDILLLAYTNRAVDEICAMLSTIEPRPQYIRIGREFSCAPEFQDYLLANTLGELSNRQEVIGKVKDTHIFVSTVASMNSHLALFKLKHFQVAIFDEASQILEPHLLPILTSPAIDKIVMIGDHKQLPAVVVQDEKKSAVASPMLHAIGLTNCRNSLFERLYEKYRHREDIVAMLNHQGRMHPDIAAFASRLFYENRLLPVGLSHQKETLLFTNYDEADSIETLVATRRCAFVHVPRPSFEDYMPKANVLEAQRIAQIVKKICIVHQKNGISFDPSRQLGIIVPYRRQIATVHTEVANLLSECGMGNSSQLLIDTVERFQGSQRDIIIYGTTIVQYYELERLSELVTIGGTLVDRKLNVAITRARKQFIMLGNEQLLSQNVLYSQLIDFCKGR